MIITISGLPGSGKSSIAKALAKTMGYRLYNAGETRRAYAQEHGMTLDELNKKAEKDPTSDYMVDERLKKIRSEEDDIIVDARLGYHFIPASIKVFVTAADAVRADRVVSRKGIAEDFKDAKKAKALLERRVKDDQKRYKKLYGIDPYQEGQYDLVIDSSKNTIEELAGQIYRFARFREHRL